MRLRYYMILLSILCVAGAAVVAALSLGFVGWPAFAVSAIIGVIVGLPGGIWLARRIKKDDPAWDQRRDSPRPVQDS